MKKIVFLVMIALALFLSCGKKPIEKSSYTVGINSNENYPFEFKGEEPSGVTGFEKELILEIAKRGNFKIDFIEKPFSQIISGIKDNDLDMGIGLITITDQRKKIMNFSKAYITTEVIVLGNKEKKDEKKDNIIYGITSGSYFKDLLKNKKNITVMEEVDTSKIVESLINQEVDYIIIDKISWDGYIEKNSVLYEKEILKEESIGIALSKNLSEDFTNKIDNIILSMESDGSLNNLKKKYNIDTQK